MKRLFSPLWPESIKLKTLLWGAEQWGKRREVRNGKPLPFSACSILLHAPQGQHGGNQWQNWNHTDIAHTPPNPSSIQTVIKCPKTEFNTWLKGFAPGFSAHLSYEKEQRECTLDFLQHCLSGYFCVQTETGCQQLKKASLPQQPLPDEVILFASGRGAVTSPLLALEVVLMAEGFHVPACFIFPSYSELPLQLIQHSVWWSCVRNQTRKTATENFYFSLENLTFGVEALFSLDQHGELYQLTA